MHSFLFILQKSPITREDPVSFSAIDIEHPPADDDESRGDITVLQDSISSANSSSSNSGNGIRRIVTTEDQFPNEMGKTAATAVFLFISFFINTVSLVLTHQRLPGTEISTRDPLPDIILDNIPTWDAGLEVAELMIMVSIISTIVLLILHKCR
jgi:hypothetical protein